MQHTEVPIRFGFVTVLIWFCLLDLTQLQAREQSTLLRTGSLITDKDTVFGISKEYPSSFDYWTPKQTILIRNVSGQEIVLDSAKLRPDSATSGQRLTLIFTIKTPNNDLSYQTFCDCISPIGPNYALRNAIRIPAHDSLLFGQFALGIDFMVPKISASSKRYAEGDSIMTPIIFYSGKDTVQFQLKTIVIKYVGDRTASILKMPKGSKLARSFAVGQAGIRADGRLMRNGNLLWWNLVKSNR